MPSTLERFDEIARAVYADPEYLRERDRLERNTWAMWQEFAGAPGYLGRQFAGALECPMPFAPAGTYAGARYLDADGGQLWPPDWSWPMWNHDRLDRNQLDRAMGTNPYGVKPGESDPNKGMGMAILCAVFFALVVAFVVFSWLA